jgi:hypothetical protein
VKNWKRWAAMSAAAAASVGTEAGEAAGAAAGEAYTVESRVLSAPASVVKGWEEAGGGEKTRRADSLRLWMTNTVEEALRILAAGTAGDSARNVDILSAPRIAVLPGRPASVSIASTLQYLDPAGDGLWRARDTDPDASPGVFVDVTVRPAREEEAAELDVALRVVLASGREKIEGLNLDAGRPILSTREIKTRVTVKLGEWIAAGGCDYEREAGRSAGPARAEPHRLLFLVRVTKGADAAP